MIFIFHNIFSAGVSPLAGQDFLKILRHLIDNDHFGRVFGNGRRSDRPDEQDPDMFIFFHYTTTFYSFFGFPPKPIHAGNVR